MKNLKLHNLRCFIKWHPDATHADYVKELADTKAQMTASGLAYYESRKKRYE